MGVMEGPRGVERIVTNDETRAVLMRYAMGDLELGQLREWSSVNQRSQLESPYEATLGECLQAVLDEGFDVELALTSVDRLAWELT